MRARSEKNGISVRVISGNHVVLLGFNATEKARKGLLGFAIKRIDNTEDESYWLKGFRHFEHHASKHHVGSFVSTWENPIQDFLWGDYTAKPGYRYTYIVVPAYGKPHDLRHGRAVEVNISTEAESEGVHAVYFNRGAAGSQAYASKFHNRPPDEVGPAAFKWLSRGLVEAMVDYIRQARGKGWGLYASVYEFNYLPVLEEFKNAFDRGVDVKIVFDNKATKSGPGKENRKALKKAGLLKVARSRKKNPSYISHNKFILLLKNGKPKQVWTGSTNITEGGIFGHSNVGHIVRDQEIASGYLDYWRELHKDPEAKQLRPWNVENSPLLGAKPPRTYLKEVFSPRSSLKALEWYADAMEKAKSSVFLTAAFGVNEIFLNVLEEDRHYLRYILLDKPGKGLDIIKRDHDNLISIGGILKENKVDEWHHSTWEAEKLTGLNTHVQFIHTKYMLIDPLSDDPLVITGSANFSNNSTKNNDENMVIIRGNKRVADMYLGEFMRLFHHFRFRGTVHGAKTDSREGRDPESLYLAPDDSWTDEYYKEGHSKMKERLLFT